MTPACTAHRPTGAPVRAELTLFNNPMVLGGVALLAMAHFVSGRLPSLGNAFALMLPDNDDAMRLVAVRDLLAGQAWFDPVQHRMKPAEGAAMHWSRLVDAPLAGLMLALQVWWTPGLAERIAVAFWPPLLLLAYLGVTGVAVHRLFGFRAACFAVAAACALPNTAGLFEPGRIDHHNVQVLAMAAAALCAAGRGRTGRLAAIAGACCGFSLAVGLETLPFVACLGVFYGLVWVRDGAEARTEFAAFAACLGAGATLLFFAQTGPDARLISRCDALSWPWLVLTGASAVSALGLAAATPRLATRRHRLAAAAGLAVATGVAFAALAPACLGGPFPDMPATVRSEWLSKVTEAMGALAHLRTGPHLVFSFVCPMIVAAAFATHGALRGPPAERRALAVFAALLWTGTVVALVQIRGAYVGSVCVPFVTGWAVHRLLLGEAEGRPALRRGTQFGAVMLLLAQTWLLALPLVWLVRPDLRPVPDAIARSCHAPAGLAAFDRSPPGLVLGPIDLGPHLLLHTRHSIAAAPYHRNGLGLLAGIEAFSGTEADMRRHVDRLGADYVAVCPAWLPPPGETRPFARALVEGVEAPWLERIPVDGAEFQVWRVRRSGTGADAP